MNRKKLGLRAFIRWFGGLLFCFLLFWATTGQLVYKQGIMYILVLFLPMGGALIYFLIKDPELLRRRLVAREKEKSQKRIMAVSIPYFIGIYVFPGLDIRFGWSRLPVYVSVFSCILVLLGYFLFLTVLKQNNYAARTVQVEEGQKVIKTGLYSRVRHPLYSAVILMYLLTPLALGSLWTMILSPFILPILLMRIRKEEQLLLEELSGYREYCQEVPYRLIPGLW